MKAVTQLQNMGDEGEELAAKLQRRQQLNDGEIQPEMRNVKHTTRNLYLDNPDMPKATVDDIRAKFDKLDEDKNGLLDKQEMMRLFEDLKAPQTFKAINEMIQKVDKDQDGAVNVQEFIELFKIAASDQFDDSTIWKKFARLSKVDVSEVGVSGARDFFTAKEKTCKNSDLAAQLEEERAQAKAEAEEKKQRQEEMRKRREQFEHKE